MTKLAVNQSLRDGRFDSSSAHVNIKNRYRQCLLEKDTCRDRVHVQVVWIPEDKAVLGKYVKLKDPVTKMWDDGWIVVRVGETVRKHDYIMKKKKRTKFNSLKE